MVIAFCRCAIASCERWPRNSEVAWLNSFTALAGAAKSSADTAAGVNQSLQTLALLLALVGLLVLLLQDFLYEVHGPELGFHGSAAHIDYWDGPWSRP